MIEWYSQACIQPSKLADFALEFLCAPLALLLPPQTPKSCSISPVNPDVCNVEMYVCIAQWVLLSYNKPRARRVCCDLGCKSFPVNLTLSDLLKGFIDGSQIRANETRWLQKESNKVSSQACKSCLGYSFSAWVSMPYHQNILFSLFNPQIDRWPPIFKQVAGQSKQEKRQPSS
jgi:hypothetical protein